MEGIDELDLEDAEAGAVGNPKAGVGDAPMEDPSGRLEELAGSTIMYRLLLKFMQLCKCYSICFTFH